MSRTYLASATSKASSTCSASNAPSATARGRYSVAKLIAKHGRMANMMKWREQLNGDCPKRFDVSLYERCNPTCPDLPQVC
jgi:hypothetical protein